MILEVLAAIGLGILFGIITGLTPGIHINLISTALLTLSALLLQYTSPLVLSVFVVAMSVTHTFLDSIPSIFLGAPESATALGVLPGHRYLLKGFGLMAVKLTIMGSFGALILSIFLFPLLIPAVAFIYPIIKDYIGYILIIVVFFMILRDRKRMPALMIFTLSGTLGLIVFSIKPLENPLFPMLSGLFGISTLLYSLSENESFPEQKQSTEIKIKKTIMVRALGSGVFSGWLTSMLPGLGAATAAVLAMQLARKIGDHGFMILMGSINTVNFILSLVTFYVLDKARNGSVMAVQKLLPEINIITIIILLSAILIAGSISVFLALKIGRIFSILITKVSYKKLILSVIAFITILVIILSGPIGLLVMITSTAIGFLPAIIKVSRTHGMGCLLLPVIIYFLS